jgi:hypothetical protein
VGACSGFGVWVVCDGWGCWGRRGMVLWGVYVVGWGWCGGVGVWWYGGCGYCGVVGLGVWWCGFVCLFVCEASGQKIETLCQYRRSLRNITYA